MIPNPVKQLITLIGQAGGMISISLADLREVGVLLSLENICDDTQGRIVLRLGPKIYYVPQAAPSPEPTEQVTEWPNAETTAATAAMEKLRQTVSRPLRTSSPQQPQENPVALEMEAVQRLTNRPRERITRDVKRRLERSKIPVAQATAEDQPLPYPKPGVHRLSDIELWFREQAANETRKIRDNAKGRATDLREGELPFRTIPGR